MPALHLSKIILVSAFLVFAKPTLSQDQDKGTGLLFLSEEEYKSIPLASTAMMGDLPPSKDLSSWFPRPGHQGRQGSCVAWAVAYGLKSYQEAVERRVPAGASGSKLFSPAYVFNQIKISDCGNGSYIVRALELLKREGVATLDQFPYDPFNCTTLPNNSVKAAARPFAIAEWRKVDVNNEADVKSHIASGFPVVIGMMVDDGFQALTGDMVYYGPSGNERGGHAMVVVGYDDNRGAFKVLNSWGTQWGNGGYGWISYPAFKRRVREAYSVQDIVVNDPTVNPNPNPVPQPDIPVPVPSSNITASLQAPLITHNVQVNSPMGLVPGMIINVPGMITNGLNASAQMIIRFYFQDGRPLLANPSEPNFRDINGLAATGTPVLPVLQNPAFTNTVTVSIPYYALNFAPSGGVNTYFLAVQATMYINQFEKAKSPVTNMTLRW